MSDSDNEFDDFLTRRKPVFRRPANDPLEPPDELDRLVLRQAREAIKADRSEPLYQGARWGMPVALAATVLVVLTAVLHVGMSDRRQVAEVTVQEVSQAVEYPLVAREPMPETPVAAVPAGKATVPAAQKTESAAIELKSPVLARSERTSGVPSGLVSTEEASRYTPAPPPPPASARARTDAVADAQTSAAMESTAGSRVIIAQPPPSEAERAVANASSTPAWRRDAQTWIAEIERLRLEGKNAEADAELAEYKRQHRAYAVGPDR
jgi:hypothetical protein